MEAWFELSSLEVDLVAISPEQGNELLDVVKHGEIQS
jgi:hypothetical protein